jgi:hypothetical protein
VKSDYQGCPTAIKKKTAAWRGIWQLEERESTSSRVHEARTDGVLESGFFVSHPRTVIIQLNPLC